MSNIFSDQDDPIHFHVYIVKCTLHKWKMHMFHVNCTLHITHIVYCMIRIVHCPPIAYCQLPNAYCQLPIVYWPLPVAQCTQWIVLIALYKCTMYIALYKCTVHIALCSLQIAQCTSSFNFVSLWNRSSHRSPSLARTGLPCCMYMFFLHNLYFHLYDMFVLEMITFLHQFIFWNDLFLCTIDIPEILAKNL